MRLRVGDVQRNISSGKERTVVSLYGNMVTVKYNKSGLEFEVPRVKAENDKGYTLVSRRVVKDGENNMRYKVGDKLLYKSMNMGCEVVAIMPNVYKVRFDHGYVSNYGRDYVESEQFIPILSRGNKDKQKEEPMKEKGKEKSKKNEGYRFRVSSLHAVDVNRIERESLTKENPVAILHSKGEFKVVVHDDLYEKGVWGVESSLSLLFSEAYHKVGGDFRPMNKEDLESFLDLAKRVRYAPYKGRDPREIRVDIPKI